MKFLREIWNDLRQGENIDLYLTIIAALGISILNLSGIAPVTLIPTITLAVLALLAVTNLVNRHKLDDALLRQQSTGHFLEDFPASVNSDFVSADELWLAGYILGRTLWGNLRTINEKLLKNQKIYVLIFDPGSDAMRHFDASLSFPVGTDELQKRINSSLETLKTLSEVSKKHPGKLQVRLTDHPLFFGTYAMNINSPSGKMYIELYKYKGIVDDEPKMVLTKKDGHWFEVYKEQLFAMWQDAKPYTI